MKNMLLAASALGVLIATLIVAFGRQEKSGGRHMIGGAAKDAYPTLNTGMGGWERSSLKNLS